MREWIEVYFCLTKLHSIAFEKPTGMAYGPKLTVRLVRQAPNFEGLQNDDLGCGTFFKFSLPSQVIFWWVPLKAHLASGPLKF